VGWSCRPDAEPAKLRLVDSQVELTSCNGQSTPEHLALFVTLELDSDSAEPVEVLSVAVTAEDDAGATIIDGEQTLAAPIVVAPHAVVAARCKDGFAVQWPGEGARVIAEVTITYRADGKTHL